MDFLELMKLCFGYPSRLSSHPTPQKCKGLTGDAVPVIGRGFQSIVLGNLRAPLRIGYEGAQCLSDGGDGCGIEPGGILPKEGPHGRIFGTGDGQPHGHLFQDDHREFLAGGGPRTKHGGQPPLPPPARDASRNRWQRHRGDGRDWRDGNLRCCER